MRFGRIQIRDNSYETEKNGNGPGGSLTQPLK